MTRAAVLHEVLLEPFGDEYLEEQAGVDFLISEEESRTLAGLHPAAPGHVAAHPPALISVV